MNELEQQLALAKSEPDNQKVINSVYLTLIRTNLLLPSMAAEAIQANEPQDFHPLFIQEGNDYFIPAFDNRERLSIWAQEQASSIQVNNIIGRELFLRLTPYVHLVVFIGETQTKIFVPDEIAHVQRIISKINALAST